MALCCGSEFPNAVDAIKGFLIKTERLHDVLYYCKDKGVPARFPAATLRLLDALVGDRVPFVSMDLRAILGQISLADSQLTHDPKFVRLDSLARSAE